MTIQKRGNLVVLSIPFQRLLASHYSEDLKKVFRSNADLVVISPFADNENFVKPSKYDDNIKHIKIPDLRNTSSFANKLFAISTILRVHGYWLRRRKEIPAYWATRHLLKRPFEADESVGFLKRIARDFVALIGFFPASWKIFDYFHGGRTYKFEELQIVSKNYSKIILVQAATWGFQDAVLAYWGRRHNWRTIMLPYSSDQLYCNGYLYSNFNTICAQGEAESFYAENFHGIKSKHITKLGSVLLRSLSRGNLKKNTCIGKKRIMYAGLEPTFFPAQLEMEVIKKLNDWISAVLGDSWELIYRPVRASIDEYSQLTEELKEFGDIKIQKPDSDRIGLDFFKMPQSADHACELKDMFNSVEVLVCSGTTSLSVEAAFLGIPTVSYYPLGANKLRSRYSNLYLNSEGNFIGFESLPIAQNNVQLQEYLLEILSSNEKKLKITKGVLRNWDYTDSDYINLFQSILYNDY